MERLISGPHSLSNPDLRYQDKRTKHKTRSKELSLRLQEGYTEYFSLPSIPQDNPLAGGCYIIHKDLDKLEDLIKKMGVRVNTSLSFVQDAIRNTYRYCIKDLTINEKTIKRLMKLVGIKPLIGGEDLVLADAGFIENEIFHYLLDDHEPSEYNNSRKRLYQHSLGFIRKHNPPMKIYNVDLLFEYINSDEFREYFKPNPFRYNYHSSDNKAIRTELAEEVEHEIRMGNFLEDRMKNFGRYNHLREWLLKIANRKK